MDYEIAIKLLSTPDDKTVPSLKCELVKDDKFKEVACSTDPEQKHRFSLDNTVYGNRAIAVSVSPGRKISANPLLGNHSLKRSPHLL